MTVCYVFTPARYFLIDFSNLKEWQKLGIDQTIFEFSQLEEWLKIEIITKLEIC